MTDGLTQMPGSAIGDLTGTEPMGAATVPSGPLTFADMSRTGDARPWTFIVGVPTILILYILVMVVLALGIAIALSPWFSFSEVFGTLRFADLNRDWSKVSNTEAMLGFLVLMITFPPLIAAIWLVVRFGHKRPFRTVLTGRPAFDYRAFFTSLGISFGVIAAFQAVDFLFFAEHFRWVYNADRFLMFLPLVLLLVPLQVLAEEILFRGYLLQMVGRFTRNPYLIVGVVGVLFASAHLLNPEVGHGGNWAVAHYIVMAFYLTWLAIRGNGLEYAFGFHLGNNLFALSIVTSAVSSFPSPTLFYIDQVDLALELPFLIGGCALHYWLLFGRRGARRN